VSELRPLQKTDLFALVGTTLGAATLELPPEGVRHDKQLDAVPNDLKQLGAVAHCFTQSTHTHNGKTTQFCRFNLIVALEWVPSVETLASLKTALTEASRLLFDVTDGYMALGEVLLGGLELMGCADIQIFASNRLFPRCSVNAMHDPDKYRPIRLGRGLWDKKNRTSITWSARDGFATLVHELGHHALGLKDQYLGSTPNGLVVPQQSLVVDTIMASLSSSELLAPRPNRNDLSPDSEWEALRRNPRFCWMKIEPNHKRQPQPPDTPSPAPTFSMTAEVDQAAQELVLVLDPGNVAAGSIALDLGHCWVYLLRLNGGNLPVRLIPQGSYEARSDGFRLLGAKVGDQVLLCGSQQGSPELPMHLLAQIGGVEGLNAVLYAWQNVTPTLWPQFAVAPETGRPGPQAPYKITFEPPVDPAWTALTFPIGGAAPPSGLPASGLEALDGHVLLVSRATPQQLVVASYSLGGSTASAYPAHPNPIPAGSPDGNAMLFFSEPVAGPNYAAIYGHKPEQYLIVSTTNHHDAAPASAGHEPRSYSFSVAANFPLNDLEQFRPTLVLYYDQGSRDSSSDELAIFFHNGTAWQELAGCEDMPMSFFVAAPLNDTNAPGLFRDQLQPERYRLFLKRKPTGGGTQ